ncbi:holo-ACP synthase [Halomonas sp. Bachu 37]|uniref:holo-ACP synthase n=1 Tax=Halomonas kashgarensis TaxID=3084920 RepID=UPI003216E40D
MIVGIGTDIARIERFERALARHGLRFMRRVLGPREQARYSAHAQPVAYLAKRFAAKEAFLKALGTGLRHGMRWGEIEILNDAQGKPELHLSGAARQFYASVGVSRCHVSLSDEKAYAIAFVILER